MIFNNSNKLSLSQMAKWIDSTVVTTEEEKNLQVEYLYYLILHRAKQSSFFKDTEITDDFTLFCVSKILVRINNIKESPLKSVVNYIRTSISFWYAEYVRTFCCSEPNIEVADYNVSDFGDYLIDASSEYDFTTLLYCSEDITSAIRAYLKKIPRRRHSAEWQNICISCYLTLQDRIFSAIELTSEIRDGKSNILLNKQIRELKNRPPILFHIEESRSNYISVLVNELIHVIAVELTYTLKTNVTPSDCLKNMAMAANNDEDK